MTFSKNFRVKTLILLSASLPLAACMGGGFGPPVGVTPPPPAPAPPAPPAPPPPPPRDPMPTSLSTQTGDTITVVTRRTGGATVRLCMRNAVTFDKGFSINGGTRVNVDRGQTQCREVAPGFANITLFKRRLPGAMRPVGNHQINFRGYEGFTITMNWVGD